MSNRTLRDVRRRGDIVLSKAPDFQGGRYTLERDGRGGVRLVPERLPPPNRVPRFRVPPGAAGALTKGGARALGSIITRNPIGIGVKVVAEIGGAFSGMQQQVDPSPNLGNGYKLKWCSKSTQNCNYTANFFAVINCPPLTTPLGYPVCPSSSPPVIGWSHMKYHAFPDQTGTSWRAFVGWLMYPARALEPGYAFPPAGNPGRPVMPFIVPTGPGTTIPAPAYTEPDVPPALAPESQPIGQPTPTPQPIPWKLLPKRKLNPLRVPGEQWQGGYTWPGLPRVPWRDAFPVAGRPETLPTVELKPGEGTKEIVPEHTFAPPVRGTKERKLRAGTVAARAILKAVNFTTEEFDLIDALYKAVPEDCKKRAKKRYDLRGLRQLRPQHKAQVVFHCLQVIPLKEAVRQIAKNEVEDLIYGSIGMKLRALNRKSGALTGVQRGPGGFGKVPDNISRDGNPVGALLDALFGK